MSYLVHKSSRLGILALILMLAGAANLFTVSVDNDDDDDTPPITVELGFLAPAQKSVQTQKIELSKCLSAVAERLCSIKALRSGIRQLSSPEFLVPDPPQFVIPLRT